MTDLTLIYYTANLVDEKFANNIRQSLLSFGLPIISVSQKPLDFGYNICVGDIGASIYNIYKQVLIGAIEAKTKYVACCEDDALYNEEHFRHRPPDGTFSYNVNRWNANRDLFFWRNRANMSMCIASTELMVDTLETRFKKFPNPLSREKGELIGFGEPGRFEEQLGLPIVGIERFQTRTPTIVFNHRPSVGGVRIIRRKDKIKRELPYWGKATELWEQYWNGGK
jgi:hypothetical protein